MSYISLLKLLFHFLKITFFWLLYHHSLAFIACVLSIENYIHFLKKCARFYTFFENLCTLKNIISYGL